MIISFHSKGEEDIFHGINSKEARKKCPREIWNIVQRKFDLLDSAIDLNDLRIPPGNRLEKLKGNRSNQFSIRVNEKFRICFEWHKGPENLEIIDYHE